MQDGSIPVDVAEKQLPSGDVGAVCEADDRRPSAVKLQDGSRRIEVEDARWIKTDRSLKMQDGSRWIEV